MELAGAGVTAPASVDAGAVATICPLAALEADGARWADRGVAVVRSRGRLHAFEEQCPHGGVSLAGAEIRRGAVVCPRHGARFRLSDGKVLSGPARRPLTCFDATETPEGILVRGRRTPPQPRTLLHRGMAALRAVLGSDCSVSAVAGGVFGFVGSEPRPAARVMHR